MKHPHLLAAGLSVSVFVAGFARAATEAKIKLRKYCYPVTEALVDLASQVAVILFGNGAVLQGYIVKIFKLTK